MATLSGTITGPMLVRDFIFPGTAFALTILGGYIGAIGVCR